MTTSQSAAVVANSSSQSPLATAEHDPDPANGNDRDADVGLDCVGELQQDLQQDQTTDQTQGHDAGDQVVNIADVSSESTAPLPSASDTAFAPSEASASPTPSSTADLDHHRIDIGDAIAIDPSRLTRRNTRSCSSLNPRSHPAISPAVQASAAEHEGPPSAIRKTSPGLAARLKALGFGTAKKPTLSPPPADTVGRLNEEQLRQLDQKHQAGSINAVIARRGRPWRGAGASPSLHKSTSQPSLSTTSNVLADSPQLPEVQTPEPLAMDTLDTQKYRLPDHTNGNGTKVTLETRREHLERNTLPPFAHYPSSPPPPTPPPKDVPPSAFSPPVTSPPATSPPAVTSPSDFIPGLNSYFTPGHNRPGSIYTLSRASFANQLAQLTSLQLPDAESLSSKVSAIPTAQVATRALINAAEQIRSWISKAQEVIGGLDSDDDVEWAAAGGREGLEDVENAIVRFEDLINAYVGAIEELQSRGDISSVAADDLRRAVAQMDTIVEEWAKIKRALHNVRAQVEIAMEWEELWNNVLGDIQGEMDELSRLVFEMEERRHKGLAVAAGGDGVDIGDLETIVEDGPVSSSRLQPPNRFSLSGLPISPGSPNTSTLSQDDSSLLALFARMQPLRASLDFLPMRLSVFETRAEKSFPTACEELEMRREGLDASYKKLEKDAESLRKELGEDRWVIVFRGAGRQAQKMHESVERSLHKLKDAIDAGMHLTNQPSVLKKIESYEAKKTHYGPAIERVLSIIDRGVQDRLTVNGEILRLHAEMQSRWESLKHQIKEMDMLLDDMQADNKGQQLRDSISSMLSNDRSTTGSGRETPGSSPPSSVIMSSLGFEPHTPVAKQNKARSPNVNSAGSQSANRRHSSLPAPASKFARKPVSRLSTIASSSVHSPAASDTAQRPTSTFINRPRWSSATNVSDVDTGHNFKPLSLTTPSPYVRTPNTQRSASSITPSSGGSKLPTLRSSLTRANSESPKAEGPSPRMGHSRLSFRERLASPGPYSQLALQKQRSVSSNRRATLQHSTSNSTTGESQGSRPGSSLASSRRSLLPHMSMSKKDATRGTSPLPGFGRFSSRKDSDGDPAEPKDLKPRWRF